MVNGAHLVQHAIPFPLAVAITLLMIGAFGPFLSALAITALRSGRTGVRSLMQQFRRWRVQPVFYAIVFLGPALLGLLALCIDALSGRATPAHWFLFPRLVLLAGWTVGPWSEELGWRGYAQPKLQHRIGALGAAVLVGAIWSVWHYWPVFTPAAVH